MTTPEQLCSCRGQGVERHDGNLISATAITPPEERREALVARMRKGPHHGAAETHLNRLVAYCDEHEPDTAHMIRFGPDATIALLQGSERKLSEEVERLDKENVRLRAMWSELRSQVYNVLLPSSNKAFVDRMDAIEAEHRG